MVNIKRFGEYSGQDNIVNYFINSLDEIIKESDDNKKDYKELQDKITSDFKLNMQLVATFGFGINGVYSIVDSLMKNTGSIDITPDKVVMLTLAALSIIYLEEKKNIDENGIRISVKSMLTELKLMGIGNGIVRKVIKCIQSIKNIFNVIGKHLGSAAKGVLDMFAYASLLIPIMNGVNAVIGKYDLNMDTLAENFIGLAMGVGTLIAKHTISYIVNRIKSKFKIDNKKSDDIIDDVEVPSIQKMGTKQIISSDVIKGVDLIKEQ